MSTTFHCTKFLSNMHENWEIKIQLSPIFLKILISESSSQVITKFNYLINYLIFSNIHIFFVIGIHIF